MREWMWKLPAFILASIAVALMALKFLGIESKTMPERFESHLRAEQEWHETDSIVDESKFGHIEHIEIRQQRLEKVAFVEQCLENQYSMLVLQELISKCDSLGIRRSPGDLPPAQYEP